MYVIKTRILNSKQLLQSKTSLLNIKTEIIFVFLQQDAMQMIKKLIQLGNLENLIKIC